VCASCTTTSFLPNSGKTNKYTYKSTRRRASAKGTLSGHPLGLPSTDWCPKSAWAAPSTTKDSLILWSNRVPAKFSKWRKGRQWLCKLGTAQRVANASNWTESNWKK
jgi:hypothetical protein